MATDDLPPVRVRVVLELTLPEADPWGDFDLWQFLEEVKESISDSKKVSGTDIRIREAETIGSEDNYEAWRSGLQYDLRTFNPLIGIVFTASYPLPVVDAKDIESVWNVLSLDQARKLPPANLAIAIGQALRPGCNAQAVIARTYVVRFLQEQKLIPAGATGPVFERAACIRVKRFPTQISELEDLGRLFEDQSSPSE